MNMRTGSIAASLALFFAATAPDATGENTATGYFNADLPDAMTFLDGREVKTADDWEARKAEIRKLWCDYLHRPLPEEVPALLSAKVVKTRKPADGSTRQARCAHVRYAEQEVVRDRSVGTERRMTASPGRCC